MNNDSVHSMKRRSPGNNYCRPGKYHITLVVSDRKRLLLGHICGELSFPDGHPDGPRVELTAIGKMVEYELLHSISKHYPVIEIQDYVIMPEHMHFIVNVRNSIISKNGHETHLGQVIAGFKNGCNRRYWEITGQTEVAAKPQPTTSAATPPASGVVGGVPTDAATPPASGVVGGVPVDAATPLASGVVGGFATDTTSAVGMNAAPSVAPSTKKPRYSLGRLPLFSEGYVDVIPLEDGQLETQRAYIRSNPRNRLLRNSNHNVLHVQRAVVDTKVTPDALRGYLVRESALSATDLPGWEAVRDRLIMNGGYVMCDGYGSISLLDSPLLPVVCHRKDIRHFAQHRQACLDAAAGGAVLVSARIAKGEQDIMDAAIEQGFPVILFADNGFPAIYHPSEMRLQYCDSGRLLILSPWEYQYRHNNEDITVAQCKTMNCMVQAVCKKKDDWWKASL